MWVIVFNSWRGAFPLINCLEMCMQNGSVHCICNKVSLQSIVRSGGVVTLAVSDGSAPAETLDLLWVQVVGPSAGGAVTVLLRMLVVAASFLGTSASKDR